MPPLCCSHEEERCGYFLVFSFSGRKTVWKLSTGPCDEGRRKLMHNSEVGSTLNENDLPGALEAP